MAMKFCQSSRNEFLELLFQTSKWITLFLFLAKDKFGIAHLNGVAIAQIIARNDLPIHLGGGSLRQIIDFKATGVPINNCLLGVGHLVG
jgi:hypothetical protein